MVLDEYRLPVAAPHHPPERHAPLAYLERPFGHALCLSGGGFRAAVFHLGALRRLNEFGLLSRMETIVSVSGGSILAAHLARQLQPWPAPGTRVDDDEWETRVARPFRALVRRNLRTWPLVKGYVLPWYWWRDGTAVNELADRYADRLWDARLRELPVRPRFLLCATELSCGRAIAFSSGREYGLANPAATIYSEDHGPLVLELPDDWLVARAVAASSAFPPAFDAMRHRVNRHDFRLLGTEDAQEHQRRGIRDLLGDDDAATLRFTDGGVFDNMGLEPVWQDHRALFVSDGGATFDTERSGGLLWRLRRYPSVQGAQVTAIRKRWLLARYRTQDDDLRLRGAYWGIGSDVNNYTPRDDTPGYPGYPPDLVEDIISEVRTDMDAFDDAEIEVLENHGYLLANAAIRQHAGDLIALDEEPAVPFPAWEPRAETRQELGRELRGALAASGQRVGLLGRPSWWQRLQSAR